MQFHIIALSNGHYCGDKQLQVFGLKCVLIMRIQMFKLLQQRGVIHLNTCNHNKIFVCTQAWESHQQNQPIFLLISITWVIHKHTLRIGAVQFCLQQHPETRDLLPLQLIQSSPHMMAHQIQLLTEASVLKLSIFPLKTWTTDEIIKLQSTKVTERTTGTHFQLHWYFPYSFFPEGFFSAEMNHIITNLNL